MRGSESIRILDRRRAVVVVVVAIVVVAIVVGGFFSRGVGCCLYLLGGVFFLFVFVFVIFSRVVPVLEVSDKV